MRFPWTARRGSRRSMEIHGTVPWIAGTQQGVTRESTGVPRGGRRRRRGGVDRSMEQVCRPAWATWLHGVYPWIAGAPQGVTQESTGLPCGGPMRRPGGSDSWKRRWNKGFRLCAPRGYTRCIHGSRERYRVLHGNPRWFRAADPGAGWVGPGFVETSVEQGFSVLCATWIHAVYPWIARAPQGVTRESTEAPRGGPRRRPDAPWIRGNVGGASGFGCVRHMVTRRVSMDRGSATGRYTGIRGDSARRYQASAGWAVERCIAPWKWAWDGVRHMEP